MRLLSWILTLAVGIALVGAMLSAYAYLSAPTANVARMQHVDTLIVLGVPTWPNGLPSREGRARVDEGVREFRAGRSEHIIFSGAAAHNEFVEAHAMAVYAEANGVPVSAVIEEPRSLNTIQNIFYSEQIMEAHGWHSAEIISSPSHIPRAGMILRHWNFAWQTDAGPWPPNYQLWRRALHYCEEAAYDARLRLFGFRKTPFLPGGGGTV